MQKRKAYPTDLTDEEWEIIRPLVPADNPEEPAWKYTKREILNGIFYIIRGGNAWRMLPHDLPGHGIVYHYYQVWKRDGTWKKIHDVLYAGVRIKVGRAQEASAGIIDSQSVKTTEKGGFVVMTQGRR